MSRSLAVAAVAVLALPSFVAADSTVVEVDQSPAVAPFQLNLARSFSSTVEQLKKRAGGGLAASKVSRAKKERCISDELVALLKLAGAGGAYEASPSQHTAAAAGSGSKPSAAWSPSSGEHTHAAAPKPTGSRRPAPNGSHTLGAKPNGNKGGPSAAYNSHLATAAHPAPTSGAGAEHAHPSKPQQSGGGASDAGKPKPKPSAAFNTHAAAAGSKPSAAYHAGADADHTMAAAAPGASASDHIAKRAGSGSVSIEEVQKRIHDEPWQNLDSQLLCPAGETACPIFPRMGTYECVDTSSELENCGGCASRSLGEDCTVIKGALGVSCQAGRCNVFTCQPGFEYVADARDGRGACKGVPTSKGGYFWGAKMAKRD
ncbi:hypothetical protein JCM11491_000696 [Sporobolomyces phaffii]